MRILLGKKELGLGQPPSVGVLGNPQARGAAARASSSLMYQETAERKLNSLSRVLSYKSFCQCQRECN